MADLATLTTVPRWFRQRMAEHPDRPAISCCRAGHWTTVTWKKYGDDVRALAAGLIALGIRPGDRVAQFSENRYEWLVVDQAILLAQAIHVPIHAPLTGEQAAYQIDHSGARICFLSTAAQVDKLAQLPRSWSDELRFFAYEPCDLRIGSRNVPGWETVAQQGSSAAASQFELAAVEAVTPDSLATILYTSGTTGEPKGVMLSQRNLVTNAQATIERFHLTHADRRLNFLPLSHIFARTCDMLTWLFTGCELGLAQSRETVLADAARFRPTIMNGVPYFYDKVRRLLMDEGKADSPGALHEKLGGAIRVCCSGGAALPDHVYDFYWDRQLPLLQGYGLSETSPVVTMSTVEEVRRGASGRPVRDVEIRLAEDGEILTRGPNLMLGYYNRPAETAAVIRDGYFYTGDYGHLDAEGYLTITGRKKELIVTTGGKNIAPVFLESLLTEDPLIAQALVLGDNRDYLTALIVPNPDALRGEIERRQLAVWSREQALQHPEVQALYAARIAERLRSVSYYEQVRKFRLLDRAFSIEQGELTPKLSLRRREIAANFQGLIEEMYRPS